MFTTFYIFCGFMVLINASNTTVREMIAREGEEMNLTCVETDSINIVSVMYGRGGSWISCENEDQSKEFVEETCQNKTFCTIEVNDDNFRDDCWFRERLRVSYECVEKRKSTESYETNVTTTSASIGKSVNITRIRTEGEQGGLTWKLQNALVTTIGIAVGVILSSIIILFTISVLIRRYRFKLKQKDKMEEENSSQAMLITAGEKKGTGHVNLYTDPDECRGNLEEGRIIESITERQSQHMYSVANRAFSDGDKLADVFYSHTSQETYNTLHTSMDNEQGMDTLMYDHIRGNV